jgi:FMN reductase
MRTLILSTSLHPDSRSRVMAKHLAQHLQRQEGVEVRWLDLREAPLPMCDGGESYGHPNLARYKEAILEADAVVVACSIYNYDVGASAKNLIELTGKVWGDKVVGFVCAAGGRASYMAVMGLANSLMLDFRSVIVPRFVYATGDAFNAERGLEDAQIRERLEELGAQVVRVGRALGASGRVSVGAPS